jgi:hypothetical protein
MIRILIADDQTLRTRTILDDDADVTASRRT